VRKPQSSGIERQPCLGGLCPLLVPDPAPLAFISD